MINKYSSEPLYCQLKSIIIKKIEEGQYAENSKIPSELDLCKVYDISRPTVRQAITELTYSGYLYKIKGKGTFVARAKKRIDIKDYSGFTPSILDSRMPEKRIIQYTRVVKVLDWEKLKSIFDIPTSLIDKLEFAEIAYEMGEGEDVYLIGISYIPLNLFPDIINNILSHRPSHDILKGKYPLVPAKTKSTLEVIYSNQYEAKHLRIQTGQPFIKIENTLFSKIGQTVEHVIAKYRADKCRLIFENFK